MSTDDDSSVIENTEKDIRNIKEISDNTKNAAENNETLIGNTGTNESGEDAEEACLTRHRKERKEIQAEIQSLKNSVSKGDKKKKKEVMAQVAMIEQQMNNRHKEELELVKQNMENVKNQSSQKTSCGPESPSKPSIGPSVDNNQEPLWTTRVSKAQKRKVKKAQKEAEAKERIREAENAMPPSERRIEEEKFRTILDKLELKIHQVPSDGNCLYTAFVHQLSRHGVKASVNGLRNQTARHLRDNMEEFLPFFAKEDTGEVYTIDEYMEYCERVKSKTEWGGQAELKALSEKLKAQVEVIQADGPSVFLGTQYADRLSLVVTYHKHSCALGAHYNSVAPRSPKDDREDEEEEEEEEEEEDNSQGAAQ